MKKHECKILVTNIEPNGSLSNVDYIYFYTLCQDKKAIESSLVPLLDKFTSTCAGYDGLMWMMARKATRSLLRSIKAGKAKEGCCFVMWAQVSDVLDYQTMKIYF